MEPKQPEQPSIQETPIAPAVPNEPAPAKRGPKAGKPRSEAQKAATEKALAAMKERRKVLDAERREKKDVIKQAKKAVEDKIMKNDVGFVMKDDFEMMKTTMIKEIGELRALYANAQQSVAKPIVKEAPVRHEKIVERIVERVPTASAQPAKLTGHALLDKLFFEK